MLKYSKKPPVLQEMVYHETTYATYVMKHAFTSARQAGFTVLELLIVLVSVGILAALILFFPD